MNARAIVLGSGVNELVAAHVLTRSGVAVLVLESGTIESESRESGWVAPDIVRAAGLALSDVQIARAEPWTSAPVPGSDRFELSQDMSRSVEAIRRLNEHDAARWPVFCDRMAVLVRFLEAVCLRTPPDFLGRRLRELAQLAALGVRTHRLGRQAMEDLLRVATMPVADLLDEWFENDALKGILGAAAVRNFCHGPRSGGTALRLLHQQIGNPSGVFRAPTSNFRPLLAATRGIDIRRGAEVARITVREGRAVGVALANGEEIEATLVLSGLDPKRTLLALADPVWLDPELTRTVRNIRSRGVVARVTLALERAPDWSTLIVAPSLDYLERAYDDVKYGNISRAPYLEARVDGRLPDGRHRVETQLQYVPYAPADSISDELQRTRVGRLALDTVSRHVPDLGAAAVQSVLTPRDVEARYGYPEGQVEQVEPALDQLLWMRPAPELARYATPIAGLYLCGAGMHPAGGIAGAAGYNAAREALRHAKAK